MPTEMPISIHRQVHGRPWTSTVTRGRPWAPTIAHVPVGVHLHADGYPRASPLAPTEARGHAHGRAHGQPHGQPHGVPPTCPLARTGVPLGVHR